MPWTIRHESLSTPRQAGSVWFKMLICRTVSGSVSGSEDDWRSDEEAMYNVALLFICSKCLPDKSARFENA